MTAQQRYRRIKRDPLRGAQLAPTYDIAPVRCLCGHARLMHLEPETGQTRCLNRVCGCLIYREASRG